mgnify:FL=1
MIYFSSDLLPEVVQTQMPVQQPRAPVWAALALALLLFCFYNLNFRFGDSPDTIPATVLPASILAEGTFNLDISRSLLANNNNALDICLVFFKSIQERNGHLVSSYPPGAGIMAVPVYAIAKYSGHLKQWYQYRLTGKIAASLMVALSALFIFLALSLSIETKAAWIIALFYGLGTSAWSISSQALWQHGPGALCLAIAAYALYRMERQPSNLLAAVAGLFLGMAVFCRMPNFIPVGALTLFMLFHQRKYLLAYLLPLLCMAGIIAYYNLSTFGDLKGGVGVLLASQVHGWRHIPPVPSAFFSHPVGQGLADVLLSPSRGLFIYSPYVLPAFVGAFHFALHPTSLLHRYLLLWVLAMSVFIASTILWWGGATFGPRYFSETCVALTLLTGAVWPTIKRHKTLLMAFILSGMVSMVIHGIGAFFAPCGWELTPVPSDNKPERFWDWHDTEIMRCAGSGFKNGIKPPDILLLWTHGNGK